MYKRILPLWIVCVLTLIGLPSCDSPKDTQVTCKKLSLAVMCWPGSVALYAAQEKGWFKEEGLDVEFHPYPTGQLALAAALDGKADLATVAETPIAYAAIGGQPVAVAATIAEIKPGIVIIARKDRGVSKPEDLRGKTVGVTLGTAAEFFIHIYLTVSYIDPAKVRLVPVEPERLESALLEGEVDGVCVWFPHTLALREKLGANATVLSDPNIYTMTWNLTANRRWIEDNPACMKKFLRALVKANTFVAEHPDKALAISSRYGKAPPDLLRKEWPDYHFAVKLDQSLILNLEDQSRWILEKQDANEGKPPNFMDFIDSAILREVDPEAVTIIGE